MYKAIDIAKWFVNTAARDSSKYLTKMKLLKLCFIAQGIHLSVYREALFSDSVQAWKYGPVINTLYEALKNYKSDQINVNEEVLACAKGVSSKDKETIKVLNVVWDKFKNHSAFVLSEWTHREGSAWDVAYNEENGKNLLAYEISHELIIQEFDKLVKNNEKARQYRPGNVEHIRTNYA